MVVSDECDLFEELLAQIEARRRMARSQLDELVRRRAALTPQERLLARERLRSQAAEIRSELARLRIADSLARALLRHSAERTDDAG